MVKVQKPIPKKLGNKAKLDNPIKKKKQQMQKEKSTGTIKNIKEKLLESPVKEAKIANKSVKEVMQNKSENGKPKAVLKKSANTETKLVGLVVPQKQKDDHKGKNKNKKTSEETVVAKDAEKRVKESAILSPTNVLTQVKVFKENVGKVPGPIKSEGEAKALHPIKVSATGKVVQQKNIALKKNSIPQGSAGTQKTHPPLKEPKSSEVPPKGPTAQSKSPKNKKKKNKKGKPASTEASPSVEVPKVEKKVIQLQEKKKAKIAFKKAKLAAESKSRTNKAKKQEKDQRNGNSKRYDPIPYDEEKFNAIVTVENIKKIAEALKTQVEKEVATKKASIFDDYRYFLQVACFKIANCPKRMVKLHLKHALVDKDDDVLLVVPDLQRGSRVDYEPTIHHYEDLLRSHGVEGIKIMPMNQIRKEYSTFEQKRRLCATYDHFLCDGRIVSHVVGIIGKITQKPRHVFHAVHLDVEKNIKSEIEKGMRKTAYRQLAKSSLHAIPVGTHKFTSQQLAENIEHVVGQLKNVFPGGLGNVRNLHLKIDITGTSSLPLYISMAQAPEETPLVVGPREQRMIKLKREANEVLSKFAMTKEAKLIKLSKPDVEKKKKLQEMRAALKEDEEVSAKKTKKAKKAADGVEKKEEVKELELPENEEDDDDTSDEDDDDVVQLGGGSSEDEEDNDDMGQLDQEEEDEESLGAESETEIVENGLVDASDEESEEEDQQEVDGTDGDDDEDDDDDEEEDQEDDDDDEAEESD